MAPKKSLKKSAAPVEKAVTPAAAKQKATKKPPGRPREKSTAVDEASASSSSSTGFDELKQMLVGMNATLGGVTSRLEALETPAASNAAAEAPPPTRGRPASTRSVVIDDVIAPADIEQLRAIRSRAHRRAARIEESEDSDEECSPAPKKTKGKKIMKSGRTWVEDAEVLHKIPWPNQACVNASTGRRPAPDELTWAQFFYGYVALSAKAEPDILPHRQAVLLELLDDAQEYQWEAVRRAHFAFLDQLEQGDITWDDEAARREIRRKLVWKHPLTTASVSSTARAAKQPQAKQARGPAHCSYCFEHVNGAKFYHALADCNRKKRAATAPASGN